jgi:hypothetical protein
MPPLADFLTEWRDFYIMLGTASATLVGLLFVAVAAGSSVFTKDRHPGLRAFLSPSVVHFTSVLASCLLAATPLRRWLLLGLLIGAVGAFGLVYSTLVWRSMLRHGFTTTIDLEDRIWYAALPAVGYALMSAAGVTLALRSEPGFDLLALGMGLLVLVGIRNAWDMTVWAVIRGE